MRQSYFVSLEIFCGVGVIFSGVQVLLLALKAGMNLLGFGWSYGIKPRLEEFKVKTLLDTDVF